ncbi:MAG: cytochrome c oxidase subunit II, partial [Chloroflexi bacterium]|nr:cytochrome c oxidase subunit II [Chloroflexota bacterium]
MSFRRRMLLACAGLVLAFALGACSASPQSTLNPRSSNAAAIYDLLVPIFWAAVVVFVIVEALLVYSVFRFRTRGDPNAIPVQFHGNTPLEIGWTIAPGVVLGVIFIMTAQTLTAVHNAPPSPAAIAVRAIGHQWWWEFQYPDIKTEEGKPVTTASDLHIPEGQTINYTLESVDVIHSFWAPQLGGKTDLIPGHTNHGFFSAAQVGEYFGQCAEFCGEQHAQMRFRVFAQSAGDFDAWVKRQQSIPTPPPGLAQQGAALFVASACIGCHTVGGTKALGAIGPNLTHFGSRTNIAAGMLDNTPENL